MAKVDMVQRKIAAEGMHVAFTCVYVAVHQLSRMNGVHKSGLTPKEQAYAQQIKDDLEQLAFKGRKLRERLTGERTGTRPPRR